MVGPFRLVDPARPETVALKARRSSTGPCYGVDFDEVNGVCGLQMGIDDDGPYAQILDALGAPVDGRTYRLEWGHVIAEAIKNAARRSQVP